MAGASHHRTPGIPLYKIVLVGDVGVGKTSIFTRYEKDYFSPHRTSTIGVDKLTKDIMLDGKQCRVNVWDTAGLERTGSLTSHYYHMAQCILFVYCVDNFSSLQALHHWMEDAEHYAPNAQMFLAGNKMDLDKDDWDVDDERAEKFFDSKTFLARFEVSAKTGDGVHEMFESISKHLSQKNVKPSFPATEPFYVPDLSTEESLDLRKQDDSSSCSC